MNFKETSILFTFLSLFIPKTHCQVMYQAYLIVDNDTLTMWTTFVTDPLLRDVKITSDIKDMSLSSCLSGSYFPTWKIENDSIFLVKLIDNSNSRRNPDTVNIEKIFKERFQNGRVFGKEINYQIDAEYRYYYYSLNDSIDSSHYRKQVCFTIKDGKIIDKGIFENKSEYSVDAQYQPDSLIAQYTNWNNLPDIVVDRKVTIEILTDDSGKIVKAYPIKNDEFPYYSSEPIKKEGEEIWKQEALRLVKLIPRWSVSYRCGQVVDKKDNLVFLFSKPR